MGKMFIPKRIKIGFQQRSDTFTGKLSYIIYYDEKGKLRKESSWDSWRDKKIDFVEFDNIPQSGFVFNKGVQRDGYWGSGRSVIRVYDPRDFEFEISVDNLMGILMHSDVSKRDIVEQCIFAWDGTELVLLPVNSKEYQDSVEYTNKQDMKLSAKDLVEGYTYQAKKLDNPLVYIGQHEWFDWSYGYELNGKITRQYDREADSVQLHQSKGKKHVFYDGTHFITKTPADLSAVLVSSVDDNYPALVDKFFKTVNSQKITSIVGASKKHNQYHYYEGLYLILDNYLVTLNVTNESKYNGGQYQYLLKLDYRTQALDYSSSLKISSSNRQPPKLQQVEDILKEFYKEYNKAYDHTQHQQMKEQAKAWLMKQNTFTDYKFVLANGKMTAR